jgi:hypothetical protein
MMNASVDESVDAVNSASYIARPAISRADVAVGREN